MGNNSLTDVKKGGNEGHLTSSWCQRMKHPKVTDNVWLRSEKKLNCSHIQNSSGRQEPLAETPKLQVWLSPWLWSLATYILSRSLWCEVTSPHSPSSHPQIFYPQIIWCFQHETQGPVPFWTWAISSGTLRHVTSTTVGAHCWVAAAGSCCQSPHSHIPG